VITFEDRRKTIENILKNTKDVRFCVRPGRAFRDYGKKIDPLKWIEVIYEILDETQVDLGEYVLDEEEWIELDDLKEWVSLGIATRKGIIWSKEDSYSTDFYSDPYFFSYWSEERKEYLDKHFKIPDNWKIVPDHISDDEAIGPSWVQVVLYTLDKMASKQVSSVSSHSTDDWGTLFDPDKLHTLNNLRAHLSSEEEYYRDPTKRPLLPYRRIGISNPWRYKIEEFLYEENVEKEEVETVTKEIGWKIFEDVENQDIDHIGEKFGLSKRTIRYIKERLKDLPDRQIYDKYHKKSNVDYFILKVDTDAIYKLPDKEANIRIEIEGVNQDGRKSDKPIIFKVADVDLEREHLIFRPDRWREWKRKKWINNIPNKGRFRIAANTYQNFRKSEALKMLIKEKTKQGRHLAQILRDPKKLPNFEINESLDLYDARLNPEKAVGTDKRGIESQFRSIKMALNCPDVSLIRGPPGTGKTTVICEIVQQTVQEGGRVLLVAPTHVAVDNVLERIAFEDSPFFQPGVYPMRWGAREKMAYDLREFSWEDLSDGLKNRLRKQLEKGLENISKVENDVIYKSQRRWLQYLQGNENDDEDIIGDLLRINLNLVSATMMGISSGEQFSVDAIPFDLVICDESSKATLGDFLVPAVRAKKWLLVGDEKQLSPYVEREKIEFIISHTLWKHFVKEWKPNGKILKRAWIPELTDVGKQKTDGNKESDFAGYFAMKKKYRKLFEDAAKDIQISLNQWFEHRLDKSSLKIRFNHEYRIYARVLTLRAEIEDEWSEITHQRELKNWNKEKRKIDKEYKKSIQRWKSRCKQAKLNYKEQLKKYEERNKEIEEYPKKVEELKAEHLESEKRKYDKKIEKEKKEHDERERRRKSKIDSQNEKKKGDHEKLVNEISDEHQKQLNEWGKKGKKGKKPLLEIPKGPDLKTYIPNEYVKPEFKPKDFVPPKRPEPLEKPKKLDEPPIPKPKKKDYPAKPKKKGPIPRPPKKMPKRPKDAKSWYPLDALTDYYYIKESKDDLPWFWKQLVMISEFEYKSGFEILIDKLGKQGLTNEEMLEGKETKRVTTLPVQYRMHPNISKFNSEAIYDGEYLSGSNMENERGFETKVFNNKLRKNDSLVWLNTSLCGKKAMEINPGRGKYRNIAEVATIIQTLKDMEPTLKSKDPFEGQNTWQIGIIPFYRSQARLLCEVIADTNGFRRKGNSPYKFTFADGHAEVRISVVDRFQGQEMDVIFLSFTRANNYGGFGFLTVLNRLNVATTRAKHRLFIAGNFEQMKKMGKKDLQRRKKDFEIDENQTVVGQKPKPNFVSQLLNYVEDNGMIINFDGKTKGVGWKMEDLSKYIPKKGRK